MSTTRWIVETPCEHDESDSHGIGAFGMVPVDELTDPANVCLGPSRIVVDPANLPPEAIQRAAKVLYEALGLDPDDDPWESVLIYQKQLAADMRAAAAQTVTAFLSDPEQGDRT